MARKLATEPAESAGRLLASAGAAVMTPAEVNARVGVDDAAWAGFARHWDGLAPDPYAAELGTQRLRRYGHFVFRDGVAELLPHLAFVQPEDSNPLYVARDRHFEPLTDSFAKDPLLHELLNMLAQFATTLDNLTEWSAKVTPFRVLASADGDGQPTPEGLHRDGVTLVTSLLIRRRNAHGGESRIVDRDRNHLVSTTLSEPGTMLLADDRRTLHSVSPIHPVDPSRPAQRDVLVITFGPPLGR